MMKKLLKIGTNLSESCAFDEKEVGELLICPVCGDEYVHFSYEPSISPVETYLVGNRGGGYVIKMNGECGHTWELVMSHHKGNSFIGVRNFLEEHISMVYEDKVDQDKIIINLIQRHDTRRN